MPLDWLKRHLGHTLDHPETSPKAIEPPTTPAWSVHAVVDRVPRILSLASATRDYDHAVLAGTIDRVGARSLAAWAQAMGPEIWAWQRARRLTDQTPWRAGHADERDERTRAEEQMTKDLATWEKALAVLDTRVRRARLYEKPLPPPLEVPAEIMALIEAKRKAALERATRVKARGEGGGSPPALKPDDHLDHPPFPTKPR